MNQLVERQVKTIGDGPFFVFEPATDPSAVTGDYLATVTIGDWSQEKTLRVATIPAQPASDRTGDRPAEPAGAPSTARRASRSLLAARRRSRAPGDPHRGGVSSDPDDFFRKTGFCFRRSQPDRGSRVVFCFMKATWMPTAAADWQNRFPSKAFRPADSALN